MNSNQPNGIDEREWLRHMADIEDRHPPIVAAGLAADLGMLGGPGEETGPLARVAFGKLIELSRRQSRLTPEQLAESAGIELADVVGIERGEAQDPEPRTVFNLAHALNLPGKSLMQLAGLTKAANPGLAQAAMRFAARSESMEKLTSTELSALEEFVRVLAASSRE